MEHDKNFIDQMMDIFMAQNHTVKLINNGNIAIKELENSKTSNYDVIILDIMLPGANGWQILSKIRSIPELKDTITIIISNINDDSVEARALYNGADDFINKPCSMTVLLARIQNAMRKKYKFSNQIDLDIPYLETGATELSEREKEILSYVVKGYNNQDIAEKTFISENTVMNHIKSIKKKLRAKNRIHIAIIAVIYGLLC